MKFSSPAFLAFAAAPVVANGWSLGPSYFPAPLLLEPSIGMLQKQRSLARRMFDQAGFSSPRYELVDDDEKFQLSVDVPGVKEEDIDITLDENFLTVKGQRVASSESSRFSSKFSQTFSLDPTVKVDEFSATLKNGVLVVTAPKDMKKLEESVKRIPIMAAAPDNVDEDTKTTIPLEASKDTAKVDVMESEVLDLDKEENNKDHEADKKEEKKEVKA
mmetsp:Transcript_9307/g.16245  ORF Transcript_9307/g.16245 Transcript_9307/m.16245 type:complete len:217 (+) Transcript_9307:63-713(+)